MAADQARNAGNAGDQLKHALLAYIIDTLPNPPDGAGRDRGWLYAETHAGAGFYLTDEARLLAATSDGCKPPDPGAAYASVLRRWWRLPAPPLLSLGSSVSEDRSRSYPGSPVIALLSQRPPRRFTLAEVVPDSSSRLEMILAHVTNSRSFPDRPRIDILRGSFDEHLDALLVGDPLLMLVDPFWYDRDACDASNGRIGRMHIGALGLRLESRDALLAIFASRAPGNSDSTMPALLADMRADIRGANIRAYAAADTPHGIVFAGWGEGARLVAALPGTSEWQRSWLAADPVNLRIAEVASE